MVVYKIIMTPDAIEDMAILREYIAYVLSAPGTALSYIRSIRKVIETLAIFPGRNSLIYVEHLRSLGIRRIPAKNFNIYYRIDEDAGKVYILNIIYARRDQEKALGRKIRDSE